MHNNTKQELTIRIDCQIASLELDIQQANSLLAGEVLTLHKELPPLVDLMYNGRIIANGQLINLDGRLGVKIHETFTEIKES